MRSPSIVTAVITACALVAAEAFSPLGREVSQHRSVPPLRSSLDVKSHQRVSNAKQSHHPSRATTLSASPDDNADKFSFAQRIESVKCAVVGAVAGGVALTPFAAFHDIVYSDPLVQNGVAQWEFDTDMGSLEGALFAIVYRYVIREDDNDMLNQGAIGAFVLVRTLSRIQTPPYCTAAPLSCGDPLGYFSWDMINSGILSGLESAALFGGAALAMDYAFEKGFIGKFR